MRDKRNLVSNDAFPIVFDRVERDQAGKWIAGTNIVMIRIRPFKPGEKSAYTREVAPGWIVDFDADNKPIQLEILNSDTFPQEILDLLPPEFIEVPPK